MLKIKLIGVDKLRNALSSKETIRGPVRTGIRRITLTMEAFTKRATVVDTGRLRASISHKIAPLSGVVFTNVKYAPFVEFGSQHGPTFVKARHKEGGTKVLGQGMFSFALEQLKKWLGNEEKEISKNIEGKFK